MIETSFLDGNKRLWSKSVIENMFKEIEEFQKENSNIAQQKSFTDFMFELQQAHRLFLRHIGDLPLIMSCRVKGNNESHFGGKECADFMHSLRMASEKYIKENENQKSTAKEGSFLYMVLKLRDLAKSDEKYARNFEESAQKNYALLGIDNTLQILHESGYEPVRNNVTNR